MTVFIRLTPDPEKGEALSARVGAWNDSAESGGGVFHVSPASLGRVTGSPLAYWVGDAVRALFSSPMMSRLPEAWVGLQTNADFQWLRLWWEINGSRLGWKPFVKGGPFSLFYADVPLVIDWADDGKAIKAWKNEQLLQGRITANNSRCWNETRYLRRGLTWTSRTQSQLSFRAMPAGCIFAHKGPAAFLPGDDQEGLLALLAVTCSRTFRGLVALQMAFGSFEVGVIGRTPIPSLSTEQKSRLAARARTAWEDRHLLDTANEASHAFLLPAFLLGGDRLPSALPRGVASLSPARFEAILEEIDELVADAYRLLAQDRSALELTPTVVAQVLDTDDDSPDADGDSPVPASAADELLSWAIGVAFGRFDIRLATGERPIPAPPDPFDPLPARSPGMVPDDSLLVPILVHDVNAENAPDSLVRRVRDVLEAVFRERAEAIEREACEILGVRSLGEWFGHPTHFFAHHLKRYSKSRRQAPIWWPLSTASGTFTLWVNYHGLTGDTLYDAVNRFVDPRRDDLRRRHSEAEERLGVTSGREATRLRDEIERLVALQGEIGAFRAELLRVAELPYRPNQNDGALITASPLASLFRLPRWRKDLEACWERLSAGDFDWAHLAMAIWPDRVRQKCRGDRSLAIAHDLETLYEGEVKAQPSRRKEAASGTFDFGETAPISSRTRVSPPAPAPARAAPLSAPPPAPGPGDLTPAARRLLVELQGSGEPLGRAALLARSDLTEAAWMPAIRELKEKNLVRQIGDRRGAVYEAVGPRKAS